MKKDDNSQNYIADLKEWQNKMYQPGVYVGGKMSPDLKYGGKKIGLVLLFAGFLELTVGILILFKDTENRITGIALIGLGILFLLAGINKIKK